MLFRSTRCCTKSDFAETYRFGHNSCNFGLFLFKKAQNVRIFKGYHVGNWFMQPVFSFSKRVQPQPKNQSKSVQFGPVSFFFSVAWTRPAYTTSATSFRPVFSGSGPSSLILRNSRTGPVLSPLKNGQKTRTRLDF